MAYVSTKSKELKIGDEVILKHRQESCAGYFEKGTKVKIVDIDNSFPSRGYSIEDEFGNHVIECGFDL